jgi:hypothetical protein
MLDLSRRRLQRRAAQPSTRSTHLINSTARKRGVSTTFPGPLGLVSPPLQGSAALLKPHHTHHHHALLLPGAPLLRPGRVRARARPLGGGRPPRCVHHATQAALHTPGRALLPLFDRSPTRPRRHRPWFRYPPTTSCSSEALLSFVAAYLSGNQGSFFSQGNPIPFRIVKTRVHFDWCYRVTAADMCWK